MDKPSDLKRFLVLLTLGMLMMLGLSGRLTTGCSSTPDYSTQPEVIVVDTSEIWKNEDGTYTVTAGWMLRRLEYEQALLAALKRCKSRQ